MELHLKDYLQNIFIRFYFGGLFNNSTDFTTSSINVNLYILPLL